MIPMAPTIHLTITSYQNLL